MRKARCAQTHGLAMLAVCVPLLVCQSAGADESTWNVGVARAIITPDKPMWMAGYGGRTEPAAEKLHDLWIRVVALETPDGARGVILSSDTLGMSRPIYNAVVGRLLERQGLTPDQIMLCGSHTHTGPVLKQALYDIYPLDDAQLKLIDDYSAALIDKIVATIEAALQDLRPATVSYGIGTCDFAVNRRTNREPDVPMLRQQDLLLGPVDHTVPVLAVHRDDKLAAVVFGYACHNTVLASQEWSGDYAGFAQLQLEQQHPGATAMFVMGCGGDQNPLPRRTVELAKEYGGRLAKSVDSVLQAPPKEVTAQLRTAEEFLALPFGPVPTRERLQELQNDGVAYHQRWATRLLEAMDSSQPFARSYSYPVQAWRLGDDLLWINLAGEVVVDYSLKFKGRYGWETWVSAYSNDVMAYIPTQRVLAEGGYEGQTSMYVYGLPAERWADDIEDRITAAVERLVERVAPDRVR